MSSGSSAGISSTEGSTTGTTRSTTSFATPSATSCSRTRPTRRGRCAQRPGERVADQAARLVPARDWSRRGGRALERSDVALPSERLHEADEHDRAVRRLGDPGRDVDPGLGDHLRPARAVLRQVRVHGRNRRQGRQPEGKADPGGNVFEGPRSREFPVPAPPRHRDRGHVPQGDDRPRLPPLLRADGEPAEGVQEPRRDRSGARAPTAASANGSAAKWAPRPTPRRP